MATILLVDDNKLKRNALSRRLQQSGYEVTTAADGPEALVLVGRHAYSLVLLDVEMPGMSGLEVLRCLRETHSRTDLPIIMVTARSRGTDIVAALQLGANDCIAKPVNFAIALAQIGRASCRGRG